MDKFYISKVTARGTGKTDSFVEFSPGLNLIQGRSITGKTCIIKCIDFCFGSKEKPFDESLGYTVIELSICTPKGDIQITRTFGKNKVDIITSVPGFDSGIYNLKFNSKKKEPDPVLSDTASGFYWHRGYAIYLQKQTLRYTKNVLENDSSATSLSCYGYR